MRKQWKKIAIGTMIVPALALAGCSSGNNGNNGNASASPSGSSVVSETGFPLTEKPVTLKMFTRIAPANGPFKDMPVFQDYEKMTNVHVDFTEAPTDGFQEKKNLLFASNELPDALYRSGLTQLEATRYGASGQLIPLEDLIDKYAPNLKKLMDEYPEIRSGITTPEGHIYAIPGIVTLGAARTDKKWINQAWLKKLGLQMPETTDDLYNVLVAFRDKDPNGNGKQDEIPMTARAGTPGQGLPIVNLMSGSFGLDQQLGYNINIADDKVEIWMGSDRNKEMLQYLNKLYKEKLLDPQLFSQTEAQYLAKQGSGATGVFFDQTNNNFLPIQDQYTGMAPPAGPHGDRLQAQASPIARDFGAFAITNVDKYPELTMRWIDYFYSDEGSTMLRFGREGENYELRDGVPYYTDKFLSVEGAQGKITPYAGGGAPHLIDDHVASFINPPQVQEAQEKLDPYMPKVRYAAPMFDEATAQKVNELRNDIDKYYEEQSTKFIAGALSFDKWDEFQKTLKKMNIDELQKIYQDAYDTMKK
ncbi:extracellular solute-binding protein [Cohnella zeiphila]|uniref:Extracellular solute-binding protein n=1 Tax=Cohnella zeiphila TaxID=2761120 RepID=A0A7X0SKB9_9BACL|nr:extracellular solute-binding protein [Cohnella zeiphila]MBB6731569.1 extracellular solute-binding protein [Cohnella zeiphila]